MPIIENHMPNSAEIRHRFWMPPSRHTNYIRYSKVEKGSIKSHMVPKKTYQEGIRGRRNKENNNTLLIKFITAEEFLSECLINKKNTFCECLVLKYYNFCDIDIFLWKQSLLLIIQMSSLGGKIFCRIDFSQRLSFSLILTPFKEGVVEISHQLLLFKMLLTLTFLH